MTRLPKKVVPFAVLAGGLLMAGSGAVMAQSSSTAAIPTIRRSSVAYGRTRQVVDGPSRESVASPSCPSSTPKGNVPKRGCFFVRDRVFERSAL